MERKSQISGLPPRLCTLHLKRIPNAQLSAPAQPGDEERGRRSWPPAASPLPSPRGWKDVHPSSGSFQRGSPILNRCDPAVSAPAQVSRNQSNYPCSGTFQAPLDASRLLFTFSGYQWPGIYEVTQRPCVLDSGSRMKRNRGGLPRGLQPITAPGHQTVGSVNSL